MSTEKTPNLDEMLSAYLDGQLSDRPSNELKRMIRHDPDIAARFQALQRQRELLAALPVEKAPPTMAQDILANLERRFILDEYPKITGTSAGARQLFMRRILATAAMLLPLGVLAVVLWQILGPVSIPLPWAGNNKTTVPSPVNPGEGTIEMPPANPIYVAFSGSLELSTRAAADLQNQLPQAIFRNGLRDTSAPPRLENNAMVYAIRGTTEQVTGLLEELRGLWGRCEKATLTVHGPDATRAAVVEDVTIAQAVTVLCQPSDQQRMWTAERYARANVLENSLLTPGPSSWSNSPLEPVMPTLVGPSREIPRRDPGEPNVSLVITVRRL
ncbi:MAG: hypothetical protein JW828_06190 [Sedimentisphaerales bacterium]|nr:hypothetical protein [Sedimentisphaerales bacterium]